PSSFLHVGLISLFFFLQAEDGIRDSSVTGVQTCALPIFDLTPTEQTDITVANLTMDAPTIGTLDDLDFDADTLTTTSTGEQQLQIGRASCRERGSMSRIGETLKRRRARRREQETARTIGV